MSKMNNFLTEFIPINHCILLIFFIVTFGCNKPVSNEKEAQAVFEKFYNDNVPESINTRHLENAGKSIVPYLLKEIQNKDMPKRGYAILALGNIKDRRALPVLQTMMKDEGVHYQSVILRAIWHIDQKKGQEISDNLYGKDDFLDRTIELLRKGLI